MVAFDITSLSPHVPHGWFAANTSVVSVQSLGFPARGNMENQVVHFRVLSCTLGNSTTGTRVTWNERSGPGQAKRKLQTQMTYNRYFMCADIHNPPHCFAIMTRNSAESVALLQHTHGETIVGSDFYIYEPDAVMQYLGDHTPILPHNNRQFLPLVERCVNSLPPSTSLNLVNLRTGEAGYFVLKGKRIELSRCSLVQETTCNGVMCDRQRDKGQCSCIYTQAASNSYVYCFDVKAPIPIQMSGKPTLTVPHFKSLRTTKCFFKDFERRDINITEEISQVHNIRNSVHHILRHVNENGGWTIVGWYKRGEVADHGNGAEKVQNNEVKEHIVYMEPTNHETTTSTAYRNLLIGDNPQNGVIPLRRENAPAGQPVPRENAPTGQDGNDQPGHEENAQLRRSRRHRQQQQQELVINENDSDEESTPDNELAEPVFV